MKIKALLGAILFAGLSQAGAAPYTDTITVDSVYDEKDGKSITLPILDFKTKRYSTELLFDSFNKQADGSYKGSVTLSPLESLNDSNTITMDKGFDPVIAAKLKAFLKKQVTELHKPGAIIRVDMNGKVWRGVMGKRRVNSNELLNFSDRHRVGSITKTFVSSTIMQLADKGLLNLDDTIDKYIPNVKIHNKDKITIRDLIAHRTGLYNYVIDPATLEMNQDMADHPEKSFHQAVLDHPLRGLQKDLQDDPLKEYKPSDLIAISNAQPINHEPGAQYKYSNTGLILAGLIIEKITGKPVIQAVHEKTVDRLGLMRTEFPADPGIQSNYIHGQGDYNNDGKLDSKEVITYLNPSVSWAAGAMISNMDDLSKWAKAYVDGDLLVDKKLHQEVLNDCLPSAPAYGASYCLGMVKLTWPFQTEDSTKWWFGHLGQISGYDNVVFRNTSKNITVAMTNNNYFINTPVEEGNGVLIFDLLSIVDPLPAETTSTDSGSSGTATSTKADIIKVPLNPEDLGGQ
ncbi:MAG: serine hydrolase [Methylococcales bacterium]|nr:serine hydrolase [Methylococcales bacterium]MDD5753995.1 serine hydrolase [Methylococcales bacterium]